MVLGAGDPLEAIAAAAILNAWFPAIDTWIFALAVTFLLTVTNLFSVARYGEFEFWFALLKVIAIIAFIVLGAVAIVGGLPEREVSGLSSLMASHGGFVPNGYGAVLGALLTTMFSFMGTEIVTIAAAESKDPAKQITRATNSVIWRIGLFYLVSIFIVISIVPWNDPLLIQVGSYQRALELLDIPHAKLIVDLVVLVAVASCLNSAIYTSSRMVFSLAKRGDAPSVLKLTNTAHATPGGAGQHRGGLPHHHRQLLRTGEGLHLPPRQLRRRGATGVPGDRRGPVAHAQAIAGQRPAHRVPHVAISPADLGGDPVHRRRAEHHADHAGAPSRGVRHRSADDLHRLGCSTRDASRASARTTPGRRRGSESTTGEEPRQPSKKSPAMAGLLQARSSRPS